MADFAGVDRELPRVNYRHLTGLIETLDIVAERLRDAVDHLRGRELEGKPGADDAVVLDALHSYDAHVQHFGPVLNG